MKHVDIGDCTTLLAVLALLGTSVSSAGGGDQLPGFEPSRHFGEQILETRFEDSVLVHINAAGDYDAKQPTLLVLFALPNGNTIAQTIGRQKSPDVDWHFFIQHIGAQIRFLRQLDSDTNVVAAYLEADGRSWPRWRQERDDSGERIARLIDSVRSHFDPNGTKVALSSHSGGGAMILDYIDHVDAIPAWIDRIIFLDSNYSYADDKHADKLLAWLRSPAHHLGVYAYNDREVTYNGKKIVSDTGGTYRATHRMLKGLGGDLEFTESSTDAFDRWIALDGRIDFIVLRNLENKILHTVMVEKNGLVHALTTGTSAADKPNLFFEPAVYEKWIQPD
jgi:hypothetical protein